MNVLFVCSEAGKLGISPFVKAQADSLKREGVDIEFFTIKEGGVKGYLLAIKKLHRHLNGKHFDLIHAHYALSGWVAVLARHKQPIIVSIMGDDAYGIYNEKRRRLVISLPLILTTKLLLRIVDGIIVKSENLLAEVSQLQKASLIPNGINLNIFDFNDRRSSRKQLQLHDEKKYVLFLGDPNETRKNYTLARRAMNILGMADSLLAVFPIAHGMVPIYLNAADIMLLTSTAEGSPNVVKEAMACNCPIVATDVGDVRWIIGATEGCYVTGFNANDVAANIKLALEFSEKRNRTEGRKRIVELGLDSESVAKQIIAVYRRVIG